MSRLLLVDDSRSALMALNSQLDPTVFSVITATSGAKALTMIEKTVPDCILTDFNMPEMDGPSFCKKLKADPRFNNIPVIMPR